MNYLLKAISLGAVMAAGLAIAEPSGTFRQAHDYGFGEKSSLDPSSPGRIQWITEKIMNRLVSPDLAGIPEADLATEWSANAEATEWTFKLREGMEIGCKVTLRQTYMYEFLDRLVTIALPRDRDFRGISPKSFDGRGNYAMGLKEQIVFPEIDYDLVDTVRGLDIIIVTTAETDAEARALLKGFDMPFAA